MNEEVNIKQWIEQYVDALKTLASFHNERREKEHQMTAPVMLHEFVLKYGKVYKGQPLPNKYRLRRIKECFRNAKLLTERSKVLTYCEGFVASADLPLIIHHAWAVNQKGEVIDPTLRGFHDLNVSGGERGHYMGVLFPNWFVKRYWAGSMLDSDFGIRRTVIEIYESIAADGLMDCTQEEIEKLEAC